eukprot:388701-Hanusia_phi.AAC.1
MMMMPYPGIARVTGPGPAAAEPYYRRTVRSDRTVSQAGPDRQAQTGLTRRRLNLPASVPEEACQKVVV